MHLISPTANDDLEYQWLESFLHLELVIAYPLTVCLFDVFRQTEGRLVTAQSLYIETGGNRNCRAEQLPLSGIREFPPILIVPFPNTAKECEWETKHRINTHKYSCFFHIQTHA